jgi:hypothetical protein
VALERYTTGLLTELSNKNCEPIAQAVPGISAQRGQQMIAEASTDAGVFVVDDTGFPKQGEGFGGSGATVFGVPREGGKLSGGGDRRLYRSPRHVTCGGCTCRSPGYRACASAAGVRAPGGPVLDQARGRTAAAGSGAGVGVPHRRVVADADCGDNSNFLAGLEARRERYVVAVRTDFQVTVGRAATTPLWRTEALLQSVPRWQRHTIRWRQGSKGWLHRQCVAVRCWRVTRDGQRHEGWLLGERATQGQPEDWSNLPATAALDELAGYAQRRYAVEPFHEEAKGEVGRDQYQGRLWPGFHRHAVTVTLTYSILVWLEVRQRRREPRQGRPSDPLSPST